MHLYFRTRRVGKSTNPVVVGLRLAGSVVRDVADSGLNEHRVARLQHGRIPSLDFDDLQLCYHAYGRGYFRSYQLDKISLSEIVNLPAFEKAGALFHQITGMTISFWNDGRVVFYPAEEKCRFCTLIQSKQDGMRKCIMSDRKEAELALRQRKPVAYTCHAGLTDVVVPVVVGGEKIGCFYSGQSLLAPPTPEGYSEVRKKAASLGVDPDELEDAYRDVPVLDEASLNLAMGLLSIICNHLVEGEIALRHERALTLDQRKLRKAAEEKAGLERDLREMELRLLQAQLNPHFLFNALNLILGQAIQEDAPGTRRLVEELSVLLRTSLANIGSMVTLAEEMANAKSYVEIFRARFDKQVNFEAHCPEELMAAKVPALILQPLVENTLIHALPRSNGDFRLRLTVESSGSNMLIRVSDNGSGIDRKTLATVMRSLKASNHERKLTGLVGVNRRLKYYYPDVADIKLEQADGGLTVVITLPA